MPRFSSTSGAASTSRSSRSGRIRSWTTSPARAWPWSPACGRGCGGTTRRPTHRGTTGRSSSTYGWSKAARSARRWYRACARVTHHLYDLPALSRLEQSYSWLTVVPAVSDDPTYQGDRGHLVDVALKQGSWTDHQVYVCGSPIMVAGTLDRLGAAGISPSAVHFEDFGRSEGGGLA